MFGFFLIVFLVPSFFAGMAYAFLDGITLKELAVIVGATFFVALISALIVYNSNTSDEEIWNGVVVDKKEVTVPCSHSYRCNCYTTCSRKGGCTEHCSTCYEHLHDYDWEVYTSNQETITIDRVDRQGSDEPPRWSSVKMNEPTSIAHSYTNYIKGAPDSLFVHKGLVEKYAHILPEYPGGVYDYYRLNRVVVQSGVNVGDVSKWNENLSRLNADLGRKKQVNIIVVLIKSESPDFYYALEQYWLGGKDNDAIAVINVDNDLKPVWVTVMAWTTNELFKIKLRDDLMDETVINENSVMNALRTNVSQYYHRKPMSDFEYLKSSIVPTTTEWWVTMIIALIVCGGLTWYMQVNDVFGEQGYRYGYGRPTFGRRRF